MEWRFKLRGRAAPARLGGHPSFLKSKKNKIVDEENKNRLSSITVGKWRNRKREAVRISEQ